MTTDTPKSLMRGLLHRIYGEPVIEVPISVTIGFSEDEISTILDIPAVP